MPTDRASPERPASEAAANKASEKRPLSAAAKRALAEAASRRAERERKSADQPKESGGRSGPDPIRYGDWEVNGLASDF